ncbi:hypothetical protein R3P38DRAFT_1348821 [Favolaschia claudopus]|uniref:NADP-dependent oxidoreductase domain-containing protein n=1 Tax=Favolaschia claudopus TaxID=2862362 RepID=A0AAW0DTE4_9AGAR
MRPHLHDYVDTCLSRAAIFASVDTSLARLNTTYIDVLQVHDFNASTPIEETMKARNDLAVSARSPRFKLGARHRLHAALAPKPRASTPSRARRSRKPAVLATTTRSLSSASRKLPGNEAGRWSRRCSHDQAPASAGNARDGFVFSFWFIRCSQIYIGWRFMETNHVSYRHRYSCASPLTIQVTTPPTWIAQPHEVTVTRRRSCS